MRGFPLLRLVFVTAALALLAFPVWMLTRDQPGRTGPAPVPALPVKTETYFVKLTATSPATLRVMAANQPTVTSEGAVSVFETRFSMSADQPEDLAVFAEFADKAGSHAIRVEVRAGDKPVADTTLWGTRLVEDVVEIPEP